MKVEIEAFEKQPEDFFPEVEVAAAYVNFCGKLLLLEIASAKQESGFWGVPAGKLEKGEKPIFGAKRELFEETGILIESVDAFKDFGKLFIRKPNIDYVFHLFGITLNNEPSIHLSAEHCSYKWVTKKEAENLPLMIGGKEALAAYYQKLSIS